jgi:PIN domain nuclease of toxin-antitoxin system
MEYLIDTQILIWYQEENRRLSNEIYDILNNPKNIIWIGQVSIYEIAIKKAIGKFETFTISIEDLVEQIKTDGFQILHIKNSHLARYCDIPLLEIHKDPFDRLILATALSENIPVISSDEKFKNYTSIITLIEA